MKRVFIFLIAFALSFTQCNAHPPGENSKRGTPLEITINQKKVAFYEGSYALLIGISQYRHWRNLESIPSELNLLKNSLHRQGFVVELSLELTYERLVLTVEHFINRYGFKANNRLLIFFSGHGYSRIRRGEVVGYIVPADAADPLTNDMEFAKKAVEMPQIRLWAQRIESKHAMFVFDCCSSGMIFQSRGIEAPPYISDSIGRPVRQFISAGSADQKVPAQSFFTQCFIRGIEGEADSVHDGYITGTELGMYLYNESKIYRKEQTPQYGKLMDYTLDQGEFVFKVKPIIPSPHIDEKIEPPPIINASYFRSLSSAISVKNGTTLKLKESFNYSRGARYWICFVDQQFMWPKIKIQDSNFSKTVKIPGSRFSGGKLVLIRVDENTDEMLSKWTSSTPLLKPGKMTIILETKINIK